MTKPVLNLNLRVFLIPGLVFLLFYPPLLRGLFFTPELLMTHMYTVVLFAIFLYDQLNNRRLSLPNDYLDYATLALIAAYILSLVGAVNMRGAIGELLKVINYFMVFWMTSRTIRTGKDIRTLLTAIFAGTVGVALVGITAAIGIVEYPGAIVGNRMYSTFQYPNTTATFLTMGTFLGLTLFNTSESKVGRIVYSVCNLLLMTGIIASQSRGSWMLYPLMVILYFVGIHKDYRWKTGFNLAVTMGVGMQIARALQSSMAGKGSNAHVYLFIGTLLVIGAIVAYDYTNEWLERKDVQQNTRKLLGAGLILYGVIVLSFYVGYASQAVPSVASQFIPSGALARANSINSQATSLTSRVDLTKAAFKLALDYPVNGVGGEGWNALYHRYMPFLMFSTETHNYPAKVLVETGFAGLLILLIIWGLMIRKLYLCWRNISEEENWMLIWGAGVASLTSGLHSIYDFDLSMGAMGIALWCLWGIIRGADSLESPQTAKVLKDGKKLAAVSLIVTVVVAVLFIPPASLYAAGNAGAEGAQAMQKKNWMLAENKLLKATSLDPFSASYAADLAQVYAIKGLTINSPSQLELAEKYAKQARQAEPYNVQVGMRLITLALLRGDVDQALQDGENLLDQNPLEIKNYEILGKVYISAGIKSYEQGQKDKAISYWKKVSSVRESLENQIVQVDQKKTWAGANLTASAGMRLYQAEAAYYLGKYEQADKLCAEILGANSGLANYLIPEARIYQYAVLSRMGKDKAATRETQQWIAREPELKAQLKSVLSINP